MPRNGLMPLSNSKLVIWLSIYIKHACNIYFVSYFFLHNLFLLVKFVSWWCHCQINQSIFYKTFMSIFVFYNISMSILQFSLDFDVTFYSFYQGSRRILQLLKWPCQTSFLPMWSPKLVVHNSNFPVSNQTYLDATFLLDLGANDAVGCR